MVTLPALNLNSSSVTMTAWINPYTNVPANVGALSDVSEGERRVGLRLRQRLQVSRGRLNWVIFGTMLRPRITSIQAFIRRPTFGRS